MMYQHHSLLRDCFGQSYQLIDGHRPPHPAARRKDFWCPELTKRFLRELGMPVGFWRQWLRTALPGALNNLSDINVMDVVAQRLVRGDVDVYEFPYLEKRALRNGEGAAFSFVKGPDPFPTDMEQVRVSSAADADQYLANLPATPAFWHELLHENGLLPQGFHPQTTSAGEYRATVGKLLASCALLLYRIPDIPATPKSADDGAVEEAAGPVPGNRPVPLAPETKAATEFATAADLQQAKIHSRSESETLGMLGLILSKRRLGHTTDPRYVNRYHGPDDMARNKANGLAEWEGKGTNRDSTAVATDKHKNKQGSKEKNRLRAIRMTKDKAKKIGVPSNRQGGPYTREEIDLWEEVRERKGSKQHISAHTNTETGRVRVIGRSQDGNVAETLDDFTVENFRSVRNEPAGSGAD